MLKFVSYKQVIVIGASSGIGATIARNLAPRCDHLVLVARRQEKLEHLRNSIVESSDCQVTVGALDITDASQSQTFFANVIADLGAPDVLVNSAGLNEPKLDPPNYDMVRWDQIVDVNIKGILHAIGSILPAMIEAKRGHIINVGSISGRWTHPQAPVYCATKFAVRGLTEALRIDLSGTGIRLTNLSPGLVDSDFVKQRFGTTDLLEKLYRGFRPLSVEDIAEAALWCLDRPAHVNIQELVIFPTQQAGSGTISRTVHE